MHEVNVDSIRVSLVNYQRVVILKDKSSGKSIPIWIGSAEADSIAVKLQGVSVPRPLTHDLMQSMIEIFGGELQCINVTDLEEETFFAKLVFSSKGKEIELDARPSDAIALAVRAEVPIYVADKVLDKAGVFLDEEGNPLNKTTKNESPGTIEKKDLSSDELNSMSAFSEFINDLDLEGLGNSDNQQ